MCKGVPRRPKVSSSQRFGALQRFYITAAVFTAVSLVTPYNEQIFAASPNATEGPEKTVPQGKDPPGNDNEDQSSPTAEHKGVIKPPKTGDRASTRKFPTLMRRGSHTSARNARKRASKCGASLRRWL